MPIQQLTRESRARYALAAARLKGQQSGTPRSLAIGRVAIDEAFSKVYRAVAFDVDGTLTDASEVDVDQRMAGVVSHLLQRGVPVLIITGRGRPTARAAADQIRQLGNLTQWHLRRLHCITHNGIFLLQTPADEPRAFLRQQTPLNGRLTDRDIAVLADTVSTVISREERQPARFWSISREPHSLRLTFDLESERDQIEAALERYFESGEFQGPKLYLTRGTFAHLSCLDLAPTNKGLAVERWATAVGIAVDRILRIGDQGQEGGNDFDLLDVNSGFSVGELSRNVSHCHPVLDDELETQLRGAVATEHLLRLVHLFAPISISSHPIDRRISALREFERRATIKSREETQSVTGRIRDRLRFLMSGRDEVIDIQHLDVNDIYDKHSGGVKLWDWELDALPSDHPAVRLFELQRVSSGFDGRPMLKWSMYTDTGILLRGPEYYFGRTRAQEDRTLGSYFKLARQFVKDACRALQALSDDLPDLGRIKLALGIFDNVRNILLQALFAIFMVEEAHSPRGYRSSRDLYRRAVFPHTYHQYYFLLGPTSGWSGSLRAYLGLLKSVMVVLRDAITRLDSIGGNRSEPVPIFGWRECDHFVQNVTAVELGLSSMLQHRDLDARRRSVVALGLPYGGTEFPAIAQVVADAQNRSIGAALMYVSTYSNEQIGAMIRAGEEEYVTQFLCKRKPFCNLSGPRPGIAASTFVLFDDNCMTGGTLQLARDFILLQGGDVIGAVVVRFPGSNRHVHMALPNAGFVDPDLLFSFVKGLVAPSPYTRLVVPGKGADLYKDEEGTFDKAKDRIARYLRKNGTPLIGDSPPMSTFR